MSAPLPPRASRRAGLLTVGLLALLLAAQWSPFLFTDRTFYFRDLSFFQAPLLVEAAQQWRAGVFPAWNPHLAGGAPLAADPNVGTFFPDAWIVPLFGSWLGGVKALLLVRLVVIPLAAYFALRRAGLGTAASFGGAALVSLSGPVASTLSSFPTHLAGALVFLPLAVAGYLLPRGKRAAHAAGALLFACAVFAGSPEMAVQGALAFLICAFAPPWTRNAGRALATLGLGGLIAAPQWLPAAALFPRTPRGLGWPFSTPPGFLSFPPVRLLEFAWPGLLGDPTRESPLAYWGRGLTGGVTPYLLSVSVGLLPLALLPLALKSSFGRRLAVIAGGFLILSLGEHLPGGEGLLALLPFRYPEKWQIGATLALCALAAVGLEEALTAAPRRLRPSLALLGALLAVSVLFMAWSALDSQGPARLLRIAGLVGPGFPASADPAIVERLRLEAAACAGLCFALGTVLALGLPRFRRPATLALIAIALLERFPRAAGATPAASLAWFRSLRREVAPVLRLAGGGRFFYDSEATTALDPLRPFSGTLFGLSYAGNTDVDHFSDARSRLFADAVQSLSFADRRKLHLLRLADVRAVDTGTRGEVEGLEPIADLPNGRRLFRLAGSAPARLLFRTAGAVDMRGAARILLDPDFDPAVLAIAEGAPPLAGVSASVSAGPLRWLQPNAFEIEVEANLPSLLLLSVTYDPNWSVFVDGAEAQVVPADLCFLGVPLSPGRHRVAAAYSDRSFAAGAALSALALGLLLFLTRRAGPTPTDRGASAG